MSLFYLCLQEVAGIKKVLCNHQNLSLRMEQEVIQSKGYNGDEM